MNERTAVTAGALIGAMVGGFASYLFFTERGRRLREQLEPAMDGLQHDFARFQGTLEQMGRVANEGLRAFQEFNQARTQSPFRGDGTAH